MPAHSCFPVPSDFCDDAIALLEPLGVALHTIDLARIRVGDRVAIFGAGCIGLCILQLAKLAGADSVFVTDPLPWRLALAEQYGGVLIRRHRSGRSHMERHRARGGRRHRSGVGRSIRSTGGRGGTTWGAGW